MEGFLPILVMALIGLLGFLLAGRIELTSSVRLFIIFIVVNIALPSMIFSSIISRDITSDLLQDLAVIYTTSLTLNLTGIFFGYLFGRLAGYGDLERKQLAVLCGCGNTGFIGIPLAVMMYGSSAAVYAAIYDAASITTAFTLGIFLLSRKRFKLSQMKAMLNPPFVTLLITMPAAGLGLAVPAILLESTFMLAGLAGPLAMIYIGMLARQLRLPDLRWLGRKYFVFLLILVFVKLLTLPVAAAMVTPFLPVSEEVRGLIIIQAGMPSFTLATVLIAKYGGNEKLGMSAVVLTTFFSIATLPFIIFLFL
jgi:malate permease and related proteins